VDPTPPPRSTMIEPSGRSVHLNPSKRNINHYLYISTGRRRTSKNRLRRLKLRAACHAERKARFPMLVLWPVVPVEQKCIGLSCDVPWRISSLG
jgi:hypothetical protein